MKLSNWQKFNEGKNNYIRITPRDLFNESKLLKCIGRLCLLIEDDFGLEMTYKHDGSAFIIRQDSSDGSIFIENIYFDYFGTRLKFTTSLNSKETYPLFCGEDNDISVFFDNGDFTDEFREYLKTLS